MYALKAAWQILWCVPLALVWILMFLLLTIGWGLPRADKFIVHWNNMINDDSSGAPTHE